MTAIFAENGQKERINVINLSTYRKESEAVITHRCEGSWKAGISIRYVKGWLDRKDAWRMWKPITDSEWGTTVLTPITKIRFCPFCGQKLEAPEEETSDEQQSKR